MKSRFIILILILFPGLARAGEKPWIEVVSPHFRVLTNATQNDARHVARQFEQMRFVFVDRFPQFRLEGGAPLTIFVASDESTAKALEPWTWKRKGVKPAGIFHHAWEREYVMVRMDLWDQNTHEVVYHEYTHSILHRNLHWIPVWLDEGLANYYGYTRFEGNRIFIGAVPDRNQMPRQELIPVETLIGVDRNSPYYHSEDKVYQFYAESWALVHFLMFGPGMDGGKRLNQFSTLLQHGVEQKKAFQQAIGSFADIDKALADYLAKFAFPAHVMPDPPQIDEKSFLVRTMSMAETEAELGGFHLWTHDVASAKVLAEQALKDDPKNGFAHEVMGFADFAEAKDDDAAGEFSQAVSVDPNLPLSLFAKTMMSPIASSNAASEPEALQSALLKVLSLNPQFAPAYVQLARLAVRRGDLESAFGLSRKAEELEPMRAGYHLLSGQILLRMGKGNEAAVFTQYVADRWTGSDHNEAVELWNAIPAEQRPQGVTLEPMSFAEAKTVEGHVLSVNCAAKEGLTVSLNAGNAPLVFRRKTDFGAGFTDTIWYGEDHFSLCHHLEGMKAIVGYRPASDASYTGDLVELEIRDELPPMPSKTAASATK
jgi:Tfp pilus assembly protein PilF